MVEKSGAASLSGTVRVMTGTAPAVISGGQLMQRIHTDNRTAVRIATSDLASGVYWVRSPAGMQALGR